MKSSKNSVAIDAKAIAVFIVTAKPNRMHSVRFEL